MLVFALVCGVAVIGGGAATALAVAPDAGAAAPLAGAISAALLLVPALVGATWSVGRRAGASDHPNPGTADWFHSLAMATVGLSIPILVLAAAVALGVSAAAAATTGALFAIDTLRGCSDPLHGCGYTRVGAASLAVVAFLLAIAARFFWRSSRRPH